MKLELHEYISRLLFEHECVVVPGFGAFLTRYYPSEVNQATHMMRPPSRRVYFNKSIKENDGLLTKSISLSERKPYDMALKAIKAEVQEWKKTLASGKKLNLSGLGRLYLDDAGNVQFSPSLENNYLTSSYGLSIFRSAAIHRETAIRKNIHQAIEKHIVTDKAVPKKAQAQARKKKRLPWAAVLGPVIFAGIVGAGYYAYQEDKFENLAGINFLNFGGTEEKIEEPSEEISAESDNKSSEAPVYKATEDDFEATEEMKTPKATEGVASAKAEEIAAPVSSGFHIIVGSFKAQENADTYVRELEGRGYRPYMAAGDQRFHRVAIGNFKTRSEALNALNGIRGNINDGAWIYRN